MNRTGCIILGIYIAVTGGAAVVHYVMAKPTDPPSEKKKPVIAKYDLPANYLLRTSDLGGDGDKTDFEKHYTAKAIRHGAEISDADVANAPAIDDRNDGLLELSLSAKAAEAGKANAGATIMVCRNDQRITQASVEAQFCSADGSSCHVLVRPDESPAGIFQKARAAIDTCAVAPSQGADSLK